MVLGLQELIFNLEVCCSRILIVVDCWSWIFIADLPLWWTWYFLPQLVHNILLVIFLFDFLFAWLLFFRIWVNSAFRYRNMIFVNFINGFVLHVFRCWTFSLFTFWIVSAAEYAIFLLGDVAAAVKIRYRWRNVFPIFCSDFDSTSARWSTLTRKDCAVLEIRFRLRSQILISLLCKRI